jgi:small ligand-binding sensory domain FIST
MSTIGHRFGRADGIVAMPFMTALSTNQATEAAVAEVCRQVQERWTGPVDLALVFFSPHHQARADRLGSILQEQTSPRCLLGCVGEAVVNNAQEIEHRPAISLWLARWSRPVELEPFFLELEETPDGYSLMGWPDGIVTADPAESAILLLGDPTSFPPDLFLEQVNENHPGLRVMGGMASGMRQEGECRLLLGGRVLDHGAVGVLLQGPLAARGIVSQGCRPIGKPMLITKGTENLILELGGKPPLAQLQEVWQNLSPRDQRLFERGLHVGRVINEYQDRFQRGDFLVRNVLGLDRDSGALAITDRVRVGQTIQFHVRDADTADEDLHELLQLHACSHHKKPAGALLFTCNGRGSRLFKQPDHDARTIRQELGDVPLAGFFAAGELGPVGGQNFIHGFTASVVLFEE